MIKILFLIHDLGQGGAEKVLVNLVNNMNRKVFDITVVAMFGGGVNEKFLKSDIRYITIFKRMIPGNSKLMKLFTPRQLHRWFIKDRYDIEVSYLEGPSARVISGCCSSSTKLVSWIHGEQGTCANASRAFRNENEAEKCYSCFNQHVFVADSVKRDFLSLFPQNTACSVLYNTVESNKIVSLSNEEVTEIVDDGTIKLISVGTLKEIKGFDRLLHIVRRMKEEGRKVHLYLLGSGPLEETLKKYVSEHSLHNQITFLGYQGNPYKYVKKCDLFVCSSHREGFSTAATEALIVGTPICTTEVSGMKEMLGDNNEYGLIVDNNEEALYQGIKQLVDNPQLLLHYKNQAIFRGKLFDMKNTVKAVEEMLLHV